MASHLSTNGLISVTALSREQRRSFWLNVFNGAVIRLAEVLMDANLVLTTFVARLTDSNLLLGLIGPIGSGGWYLPQLFISREMEKLPRKITAYRAALGIRLATWLALGLALWFLRSPAALLTAFFLTYTIMKLASGLGGVSFMDVTGKTVPSRLRGRLFGLRTLFGGLLSLGGSRLVKWTLQSTLAFPRNYALLIFGAMVLGGIAMGAFSIIREEPGPTRKAPTLRRQWARGMRALRRDAAFRNMITGRSLLYLGFAALPFYTVLSRRVLGAPEYEVGNYLTLVTFSSLAVTYLWGWLADKRGAHWNMSVAAALWALVALYGLVLVSGSTLGWWNALAFPTYWLAYPLFALIGIVTPLDTISSFTLLLDVTPPGQSSLYVGFSNTLIGMVVLASSFGGVVVNVFGLQGLFALTLVVNLLAWRAFRRIRLARG